VKTLLAAASVILLALSGLLVAAPAVAATPTPSPDTGYVTYSGTATDSNDDAPQSGVATAPARARVDCTGKTCVLTELSFDDQSDGVDNIDLTEGRRLELSGGSGTFQMAGFGDPCDNIFASSGTLTVTVDSTHIRAIRSLHYDAGQCGYDRDYHFTGTFDLPISGGTPCVLDDSCRTSTPTPVVTAAANGGTHLPGRSTGPRAASVPSVLSVLPTIANAITARNSIWAAATAVVLVLLIAIPTTFFNQAAGKANELLEAWWRRRRGPRPVKKEPEKPVRLAGWPLAAFGVVAASLISAFVDPHFGLDAASARTFASILVSFILDVCLGWFALLLIVRKTHPTSTAKFEFKPLTLLIVVIAVLFTRLTNFQPGIVFGLVAGITFGGLLATAEKARVALIGLGWAFGLGVVAWVGYSLMGQHPLFVHETLSGIAIAGFSTLPIALLPVRGLTGATVWAWKKWVWAIAYGVGLFGFMVMLMPMPFSWQKVPLNLIVWLALYLAYAVVAVALWMLVERPWKKETVPA
jgi:hypothetical protein